MQIDLPNCVASVRVPKSRQLLPLFEAISNSIDAIAEAKKRSGRIDIYLERDGKQTLLDDDIPSTEPIVGMRIVDNGVGFTDVNFKSFDTSFSSRKKDSGGKGIGRLTWLKTFQRAEVESVYGANGKKKKRTFRFDLTPAGISRHKNAATDETSLQTTVRLIGALALFRSECRKSAEFVAHRVIEHFLQLFATGKCPNIYIHDSDGRKLSLNTIFENDVKLEEKAQSFEVGGYKFDISHVRLAANIANGHRLHFCARDRSVLEEDAAKSVSSLQGKLEDLKSNRPFFYAAYVSGKLLETALIADRNSFDIPNEGTIFAIDADLTWEQLVKAAAKRATTFLARYTAPTRKAHLQRVAEYVQKHPKYRPLLKHKPEWIDRIAPSVRDDELEVQLYRLNQEYDAELRQEAAKVEKIVVNSAKLEAHRKKVDKFLEEWNDAGQAKLCDYVVHRRAVISFLEDCLKRQGSGFAMEDIIHDTIFPMRKTSDDVPVDATNLWVIDERLSYHHYLASDKQFRGVTPVTVPKKSELKRSDIIAFHRFDNPTAIVDSAPPYDSVTIVEFKRPNRDDYTDADNPIDQVERYVQDIQAGKVDNKDGQRMSPRPGTPFYAFIICSIMPSLEEIAVRRAFIKTPDGEGYFRMHPTLCVYEEIISYNKLLSDAKKRNASFFDKLNMLPT
jgi:hypothetical protein